LAEKRVTNSELNLQRLQEAEEAERPEEKGILELFDPAADTALSRDDGHPDA
jgi:hypothetical protein